MARHLLVVAKSNFRQQPWISVRLELSFQCLKGRKRLEVDPKPGPFIPRLHVPINQQKKSFDLLALVIHRLPKHKITRQSSKYLGELENPETESVYFLKDIQTNRHGIQ